MKPDKALNETHANEPKKGDYWHEMYTAICIVLENTNGIIIYIVPDRKAMVWDEENPKTKTKAEFREWLSYDSIDGYWCDVMPEEYKNET